MILRHLKLSFRDSHSFMHSIGDLTAKIRQKWSRIFIYKDLEEFTNDERGGGKTSDSFYDTFPEVEFEARAYGFSAKAGSVVDEELADFVDKNY
ncbi:unnamed protein product [Didymodactylos carnosus]|uniref:Uncharacterized protein n=1 Tax=Didymodactylos carnosus TaxID=1234261 RepID=A0A815YL05_9BILA|nr:unnamed protein product [Didymodactylos carnosus]CAF4436088.1 unnamed protein product [Didymodactylos carnosus]